MGFKETVKNWEGLAKRDALWSILTDPQKKDGKWDENSFFKTGETELNFIFDFLETENILPENFKTAMDFGCGAGRLARPLCKRFEKVFGIDASTSMIETAEKLNTDYKDQLKFILNQKPGLDHLHDINPDFIITLIVLQHISVPESIYYIRDMVKMLNKGGVFVFQIPVKDIRKLSFLQKVRSTIRIRERLALIGIGKGFQMEVNVVDESVIRKTIEDNGAKVIDVKCTNHTDPAYNGSVKFINETDAEGYVSKMFVVRK